MNLKRIFEDAMASAGTGSLGDLGEPPVVGVSSTKKKSARKLVPTRRVTEAENMDPEDVINTEEEISDEGDELADLDPEDTVDVGDETEEAPPPIYGEEEGTSQGELDQEKAKEILEEPEEDIEAEDEEEPPKISMSRILQYKVSKPTTNRHSDFNGSRDMFNPKLLRDMRITGKSPVESFMGRFFSEVNGSEGGLQRTKDLTVGTRNQEILLGEVTSKNGRYIFTTQIITGRDNREFVFEGDRTQMEALLTIMKASMKDIPGKAKDIVNEVDTRVTPVEILVNQSELLTDGVKYVKQIVAQ